MRDQPNLFQRARRPAIAAAGVAAAAAVAASGIAGPAQAGTPRVATVTAAAAPAVAAGLGHWVGLTPKGAGYNGDVGLARGADGVLHMVWGGGQQIMDTPIAPNGTPGKTVTVARGLFYASSPDATATPSGLYLVWNADKTGARGIPRSLFWATRPPKGGQWKPGGSMPPVAGVPVVSGGLVSATTGGDGKPWIAYADSDALVVLHLGQREARIAPTPCCVMDPGLATDGKSGVTWLAYYSTIPRKQGYYLQKLSKNAGSGKAAILPGEGISGGTVWPAQRIAVTGRGKGRGGVFALYGAGYESYTSLNLIAAGSAKPVSLATFSPEIADLLASDTITAGPDGRLWATWWTNRPKLFVRATKTATGVTFGPTVAVPLPKGTRSIWKVYTSAQAGRLDVVALLTVGGTTAYYATQVPLPK